MNIPPSLAPFLALALLVTMSPPISLVLMGLILLAEVIGGLERT